MRNRGWRRKKDFSKAKRKKNIDLATSFFHWEEYNNPLYSSNFVINYGMYNSLHQYSKNKIHCSCGMCSAKTRNKGKRRMVPKNYSPSINYTIKDQKRKDEMDYEEKWD